MAGPNRLPLGAEDVSICFRVSHVSLHFPVKIIFSNITKKQVDAMRCHQPMSSQEFLLWYLVDSWSTFFDVVISLM